MIKCGYCWGENCQHLKIEMQPIETVEIKRFICGPKIKEIHKYMIHCQCLTKYLIQLNDGIDIYVCPNKSCGLKIITGQANELTDELMARNFKTPRNKCFKCQATGSFLSDYFKSCQRCQGYGGLKCIKCHNLGYILSNTYPYEINDGICKVHHCDDCRATGWFKICDDCQGRGAVLYQKTQPCDICFEPSQ